MARANANCSHHAPQSIFQVERDGYFRTVKFTCWSAAVVWLFPDAQPISWVDHGDHVVVNGCIKVTELRHLSLSMFPG